MSEPKATSSDKLQVHLLGTPGVFWSGKRVAVRAKKYEALLYILAALNRQVSRAYLLL